MCSRAQAHIFLERFAGPRSAPHFLAPATKACEGSGDRARNRWWEIGSPGTSPSRAATQEHRPRHGRSMGRLDTAAHIQQPGSAMFHLGQHPCSEQMILRRAKGDSARRRRHWARHGPRPAMLGPMPKVTS